MFTVFLVIQVLVTLTLIGLILIQRSESDGLSGLGGGGGGNAFMTGRGAANLLTRTTAILAVVFMANSLWLAILSTDQGSSSRRSIADRIESGIPAVPPADDVAPAKAATDSSSADDASADTSSGEVRVEDDPAPAPAPAVPTP